MKSLLRFLLFVVVVVAAVVALYSWKNGQSPEEVASDPKAQPVHTRLPMLREIDKEFTSLVGRTLPSVVSINAIAGNAAYPAQMLPSVFKADGQQIQPNMGSGVIVSASGHIVTNLHVILGASWAQVHLYDGRVLFARLVGSDPLSDIAILKIDAPGLQPMVFGDSDKVNVGQMVFAVGNPLGLEGTVTQGIISAKGRRAVSEAANEFFQTDAAINPGNSGGPLVNLEGEIIAITNSITPQGQGIGFAIPANTVRRVFESIRDYGRFIRPWFGGYYAPSITPQLAEQLGLPDTSGALVLQVYNGSPAQIGGVQRGDVIIDYNGKPIRDIIDLRNRVVESQIGQKVPVKVRRDGKVIDLNTVIAADPTPN
ncbi:N/A [soil metagenome]